MSLFLIRPATKDDCKDIVRLIKEMAENKRMPNGPRVDEEVLDTIMRESYSREDPKLLMSEIARAHAHQKAKTFLHQKSCHKNNKQTDILSSALQKDGFEKKPFYYCFVAELNKEELNSGIVGYVLYFFSYSTWEGRSIDVQDLYVSLQYRGRGIGSALQKRMAQEGIQNGCCRLNFTMLKQDMSSVQFYKEQGVIDLTETEGWDIFCLKKDDLFRLVEK